MVTAERRALLRLWWAALEWNRLPPAADSHAAHIVRVQARVWTRERARAAEAAGALTGVQMADIARATEPESILARLREAFPSVPEPSLDEDADGVPVRIDVVGLRGGEFEQVVDLLGRLRRVGLPPAEIVNHLSPETALEAATGPRPPDLLVARGLMPGIDGPWLVDRLRAATATDQRPRVTAMVVSSADTYLRAGLKAGADLVEWLPIRPDRLGAAFLHAFAPAALPPGAVADPDWSDRASVMGLLLALAAEWGRRADRVADPLPPWRVAYGARAAEARGRLGAALVETMRAGTFPEDEIKRLTAIHDPATASVAIEQAIRWPTQPRAAPAAPRAPADAAHPAEPPPGPPVIRVAFADGEDGATMREMLCRVLADKGGMRVERTSAEWGIDAIELAFAEPRPDLLVVHQLMAWMAGDVVIRSIRQRESELGLPRLPIMAWDYDPDRLAGCGDAGADLVLEDPVGVPKFVAWVRTLRSVRPDPLDLRVL